MAPGHHFVTVLALYGSWAWSFCAALGFHAGTAVTGVQLGGISGPLVAQHQPLTRQSEKKDTPRLHLHISWAFDKLRPAMSWLQMSPRVRGLEHVSPNDADFMIAQESNAPVYPPSLEEKEELRESRKACKESYDKAEDEGDIAAAQLLSTACDVLDDSLIAKQESFDQVKKCIDMAAAAERMELGVKPVNMTKAGQWKLLRIKLQSRMQPFEAATAATAAAAATALSDSRKRRHAAIADATAATDAAGGVEELDLVRFFCRYLCTVVSHIGNDALHFLSVYLSSTIVRLRHALHRTARKLWTVS